MGIQKKIFIKGWPEAHFGFVIMLFFIDVKWLDNTVYDSYKQIHTSSQVRHHTYH